MTKLKILFTTLFLFGCIGIVSAQETPDKDMPPPNEQQQKPNLLRELGLTQDQVKEIRRINQSNRGDVRAAQQRVGEARRNLDQAIYAEKVDEAIIQNRLREFQVAQADIARIRFNTEFAIRKILTPEQLLKFRELRERFDQFKNDREQNPGQFRMRNRLRNQKQNNLRKQP